MVGSPSLLKGPALSCGRRLDGSWFPRAQEWCASVRGPLQCCYQFCADSGLHLAWGCVGQYSFRLPSAARTVADCLVRSPQGAGLSGGVSGSMEIYVPGAYPTSLVSGKPAVGFI